MMKERHRPQGEGRRKTRKESSMNTRAVWWIGFCAAAMLAVGRRPAAGETWRAVEQPELKQALESAALLQTESLGESASAGHRR